MYPPPPKKKRGLAERSTLGRLLNPLRAVEQLDSNQLSMPPPRFQIVSKKEDNSATGDSGGGKGEKRKRRYRFGARFWVVFLFR